MIRTAPLLGFPPTAVSGAPHGIRLFASASDWARAPASIAICHRSPSTPSFGSPTIGSAFTRRTRTLCPRCARRGRCGRFPQLSLSHHNSCHLEIHLLSNPCSSGLSRTARNDWDREILKLREVRRISDYFLFRSRPCQLPRSHDDRLLKS